MINPKIDSLNNEVDAETENPIDWGCIFELLYDSFFRILSVVFIVFTISLIYVAHLPDQYIATTKLRLEKISDSSDIAHKEVYSGSGDERLAYYGTQIELIQSDKILQDIVIRFKLLDKCEENNSSPILDRILGRSEHKLTVDDVVLKLKRNIDVSLVHDTDIVTIDVKDNDPFKAASIANMIVKDYIKEVSQSHVRLPKELVDFFSDYSEVLNDKKFLKRMNSMADEAAFSAFPTLSGDQYLIKLKQSLLDVQNQISDLSSRYTLEYPELQELIKNEASLKYQLSQRTKFLLISLKSIIEGDFNIDNVTVIKIATPPDLPSGPKRSLIVFFITFLSLAISILFIIYFYYFHRKIVGAEDLSQVPDVTFLGYIPEIQILQKEKLRISKYIIKKFFSDPQLTEAITVVDNNLFFSLPKGHNKTTLFCSLLLGEGKTTVTSLLAQSMANIRGKTLIIDADLRDPSVHLAFGVKNTFGFSDCLLGLKSWKDILQVVEGTPNLKVLSGGTIVPNSTAILSTPQLAKLINEMKEEFDHIIIDAPSLMYIPDAFIIAQKVDGMVFVTKSGKLEVSTLDLINKKIIASKINLVGLVINRVNIKQVFKGYYQTYCGSYGNKRKKRSLPRLIV